MPARPHFWTLGVLLCFLTACATGGGTWVPKDDREIGRPAKERAFWIFRFVFLLFAIFQVSCASTPGPFGNRTVVGADTKGYLAGRGGSGETKIKTTTPTGTVQEVTLGPGAEIVMVDSEETSPAFKSGARTVGTLGATWIGGHFLTKGQEIYQGALTARSAQSAKSLDLKTSSASAEEMARIAAAEAASKRAAEAAAGGGASALRLRKLTAHMNPTTRHRRT